jgi:hypothetical protein
MLNCFVFAFYSYYCKYFIRRAQLNVWAYDLWHVLYPMMLLCLYLDHLNVNKTNEWMENWFTRCHSLDISKGGNIHYTNMNLRTQTGPHLLLLLLRLWDGGWRRGVVRLFGSTTVLWRHRVAHHHIGRRVYRRPATQRSTSTCRKATAPVTF